jgi:hypothetical protein
MYGPAQHPLKTTPEVGAYPTAACARTIDAIRNATQADWERACATSADVLESMRLQRNADTLIWANDQRLGDAEL